MVFEIDEAKGNAIINIELEIEACVHKLRLYAKTRVQSQFCIRVKKKIETMVISEKEISIDSWKRWQIYHYTGEIKPEKDLLQGQPLRLKA